MSGARNGAGMARGTRGPDASSGAPDLMYANLSAQQIRAAKQRARKAVHLAIKAGLLTKESCFRCGTTERVEGHHTDYNAPLMVVWACGEHHREIHRLERPPREPRTSLSTAPRWCLCGQPIAPRPDSTRGRRPRFCDFCRRVRGAMRHGRAMMRELEELYALQGAGRG